MAAFSLSADTNIDALTGKTGGDTYDTNGFVLTIDQDSRVGLNQSASASLAAMTVNATKGGKINIDGRGIWMIPFSSGSGTIPAWNSLITNGTGSGKLIGVHASLTAASLATGAAMPATGFLRVKQKTGAYQAGALSGLTASADNAGRIGWLEIVGDEGQTINANRLGEVNITGDWYEIGTTNGSANQTMQIPNNGLLRYAAGVFIEKTSGQADYEFYPNAGIVTTTGTEADRGKCVWIDNTGLVRIGNSGAATNGYVPVTGLKVVIGNIFLENCTTAARTANVIPNATIGTRYDFTTSGGGVVAVDKCNMAWYFSCSQAYSVNVSNSGFIDSILLAEIATAMTWSNVGVGNKPTTALVVAPLNMTLCFAGGTFTDCRFQRVATGANNSTSVIITDIDGFTFTRMETRYAALRAHTLPVSITATRVNNTTFDALKMIDGQFSLVTCTNVNITNMVYIGGVSGTTGTGNPCTAVLLTSNCLNVTIGGFSLPVTNNHPYTALFSIGVAGCTNTKIRNIGTRVSPLNLGSANACGLIFTLATGAAAFNTKVQRVYCSNTRSSGIMTGDNSSKGLIIENVFGDYADATDVSAVLNMVQKGLGTTKALTGTQSIYGTHWVDYFTSTTAGRIAILMNEPTAQTLAQVALSGGAAFTSAGGLYMPVIGQSATFEMPEFIKGHTSFANSALVMAGGTAGNYTYEYAIDKNDGNGFSVMTSSNYTAAQLGTALNGISGIDASNGFKLKIKITTGTTNTTAITSVYVTTVSSTTAQDYQYPLDLAPISLFGIVSGSDIVILSAGTTTEISNVDANSGTTYSIYADPVTYPTIDVCVYKKGYVPFVLRGIALTAAGLSLPVNQVTDRNYIE
jgi:hypothetical protein